MSSNLLKETIKCLHTYGKKDFMGMFQEKRRLRI